MKGKSIDLHSRGVSEKSISRLRALLLSGKISLRAFVSSVFKGRTIKAVLGAKQERLGF